LAQASLATPRGTDSVDALQNNLVNDVFMRPHSTRICFITTEYPPHVGGAARSAQRLVRGLVRTGFEVVVFAALKPNEKRSGVEFAAEGNKIYRGPFSWEAAVDVISKEEKLRPFDLFHGFTLQSSYPCLDIAAAGNRPVLSSIRGIDGMNFSGLAGEALHRSTWITSVSSDSLKRAMTVRDISQCSSVIPNGIDVAQFPQWRPTPANVGVVGTVATFRPKKNIPLLIRSYSCVPAEIRKKLLLVGDVYDGNAIISAGRDQLQALIDDLGITQEVEITGFIDHALLPKYHQSMRAFVLSSDHEGMPNAFLEAAASGVPIVTTAVDGVKDIFTNGKDVIMVEPGDLDQLAEAIRQVLTSENLACRLSQQARSTVAQYTPAVELQRYIELYQRLLARKPIHGA
jgi:L-malate glycosyltransferase